MTRGTLTVRVRGVPFPIEFADWTHDRLFHTVEFEGGDSQEILAFIGGVGSPIPGGSRVLTEADTNIPRSGDTGLQEGWEMLIYSIQIEITREMARNQSQGKFELQDIDGPDGSPRQYSRPAHVGGYDTTGPTAGGVLFDFMRKTFHRFTVNQKVQSEGGIEEYPQGSGIHAVSMGTGFEIAGNGPPSPRDQAAFVLPIWLRPNIAYVAKIRPQSPLGISGIPSTFTNVVSGYINWSGISNALVPPESPRLGFDVRETLEGLVKRPVA